MPTYAERWTNYAVTRLNIGSSNKFSINAKNSDEIVKKYENDTNYFTFEN